MSNGDAKEKYTLQKTELSKNRKKVFQKTDVHNCTEQPKLEQGMGESG